MKIEIIENNLYKIGKNSEENWDLLSLDKEFMWFHLKSFPSCHVILENRNPTLNEIYIGANLCLLNTKYKNLKNIKINYTVLDNIKKGDKVGSIIYKSNKKVKTINIKEVKK